MKNQSIHDNHFFSKTCYLQIEKEHWFDNEQHNITRYEASPKSNERLN